MNLKFKYRIFLLKWRFKKIQKYTFLFEKINNEKKKFIKFFIKDEEDKLLNKKVLDGFDNKIQKYKLKIFNQKNKIDSLLFKLNIIDLDYITIFYEQKFSEKDSIFIKELLKYKLINLK